MGRGNRPSPLLCPGNSVVARAHQDAVRHACDRNEAVCLVADFHGVNGRASAEVNGGRGRGDDSLASGADVRSVQFRSNGVGLLARVSFTRVDLGGKRRCGLREGGRCAAVEDPGALAVPSMGIEMTVRVALCSSTSIPVASIRVPGQWAPTHPPRASGSGEEECVCFVW